MTALRNATGILVPHGERPEIVSDIYKKKENWGNVCWGLMNPHFNLFLGKTNTDFSVSVSKESIQTFMRDRYKSNRMESSTANGMTCKCVERYH